MNSKSIKTVTLSTATVMAVMGVFQIYLLATAPTWNLGISQVLLSAIVTLIVAALASPRLYLAVGIDLSLYPELRTALGYMFLSGIILLGAAAAAFYFTSTVWLAALISFGAAWLAFKATQKNNANFNKAMTEALLQSFDTSAEDQVQNSQG